MKVLWLPLDRAQDWRCDAPRHGDYPPRATSLFLCLVNDDAPLIVHQAMYCCEGCQRRMEADVMPSE